MDEKEKYEIAEQMAKNELCRTMCLCPSIRAADLCKECGELGSSGAQHSYRIRFGFCL